MTGEGGSGAGAEGGWEGCAGESELLGWWEWLGRFDNFLYGLKKHKKSRGGSPPCQLLKHVGESKRMMRMIASRCLLGTKRCGTMHPLYA